jgi:SagB-type dehydrogenase family enzyme
MWFNMTGKKSNKMSNTDIIRHYHKESKHAYNRFAPAPPYMDWETQPNPFRYYEGARQIKLALVADSLEAVHSDLYRKRAPSPLNFRNLSALLELSLGLSAWKSYSGESWPLRCNPSSGNLHPSEGYLIIPQINLPSSSTKKETMGGVYHYVSRDHLLEERFRPNPTQQQSWNGAFPKNTFLVGITSIHWREAWKYGQRALRYCELDTGHGAMAFRYGAATLGWQVQILSNPGDKEICQLLGIDPYSAEIPEPENPDLLMVVTTEGQGETEDKRVLKLALSHRKHTHPIANMGRFF